MYFILFYIFTFNNPLKQISIYSIIITEELKECQLCYQMIPNSDFLIVIGKW